MYRILLFLILLIQTLPSKAFENNEIKAAVAAGFEHGLHAKYLQYIANKLEMKLTLFSMPFARRLQEIRNGNLDIIVGLQRTEDREDEFIYITPYYETLSYRFFTLRKNKQNIASFKDLEGKLVGVNKHSKYFPKFNQNNDILKVDVISLKQNIQLLLKERIDVLIHYEESTIPTLKSMRVETKVVKTPYQPVHSNKHYVAISHKSHLVKQRKKLTHIIEEAIKNNDLLNIRLAHYEQLK